MSRRTMLWIAVLVIVVFGVVLVVAAPSFRLVWSKGYVETRWTFETSPIVEDLGTEFGWDASGRFYAVPAGNPYQITIVDRVDQQLCVMGSGRGYRTGHWIQAADGTLGYEIRDWTRYGRDIGTRLDLSTWEVTVTVRGTCPMSWEECAAVEPPAISTYTCSDS